MTKEKDVKEIYDNMAESYDEEFAGGQWIIYDILTWKYITDYLPDQGIVLDAGGGTGKWSIQLAQRGLTVHLVDVSSEMLKKASQKIEKKGLSNMIHISQSSITNLDFPSNHFDFVLSEGDPVSYCAEDHFTAIKELVRVAKPKTYIEIGVDNRFTFLGDYVRNLTPKNLKRFREGFSVDIWETRTFTFTPRILREEFEKCGADLVKVIGKPVLFRILKRHIEDIEKKVETDPEYRDILLQYEIALNEEGFSSMGTHLQAIARKK
jgi:ubiquinone/menaquinone biosynthesis C-methylase UbiE